MSALPSIRYWKVTPVYQSGPYNREMLSFSFARLESTQECIARMLPRSALLPVPRVVVVTVEPRFPVDWWRALHFHFQRTYLKQIDQELRAYANGGILSALKWLALTRASEAWERLNWAQLASHADYDLKQACFELGLKQSDSKAAKCARLEAARKTAIRLGEYQAEHKRRFEPAKEAGALVSVRLVR